VINILIVISVLALFPGIGIAQQGPEPAKARHTEPVEPTPVGPWWKFCHARATAGAHPAPPLPVCEPDKVSGTTPVSGEITRSLDWTWSAQQRLARRDQTANIYWRWQEVVFDDSNSLVIALRSSGSALGYEAGGGVSTAAHGEQAAIGEQDGTARAGVDFVRWELPD